MTATTDAKDFYNSEALTSARYSTESFWENRYHNKRRRIVQKLLRNSSDSCRTYLDIGCGTGEYLSFASRHADYVCGIDISKNYLRRCKSSKADDLVVGDSQNLPFQKQVFDCVLCSEVIEHIHHQESTITEILRVSRKSAVISTPNHGIFRMLMSKLGKKKLTLIDAEVGHISILRFRELLPKFENREWRISVAFTVSVFPPFLDVIHFPRAAVPVINLLEWAMDRLLPTMGSISVIKLEVGSPSL